MLESSSWSPHRQRSYFKMTRLSFGSTCLEGHGLFQWFQGSEGIFKRVGKVGPVHSSREIKINIHGSRELK